MRIIQCLAAELSSVSAYETETAEAAEFLTYKRGR